MSQYVDSNSKSFTNDTTAIGRYLRVTVSSGVLALAGAETIGLGVTTRRIEASVAGSVDLFTKPGTFAMTASAAISAMDLVYAAAGGKIAATPTGAPIGIALEAATANNDIIEVLYLPKLGNTSTVEAKTADYTVTLADVGKTFTTVGAAGTVVFSMPAATVGQKYRFRVGAAQELRIDPNGTEVIALPSTGVAGAAGKYLTANADGETVDIECTKAGQWSVFGYTGTWTAEA